ncbi:3-oxo-5-alpha-steroid 4-dehydrogenase 2 [Carlito syrichta]|uniref:3-oxo-5alpha-steroid 4-dehydrogenase (NADP(+)) n=1 Tax=Carlito syrichta TaxID=1868482 RepID=A0A1U7T9T7_CARSF|nr:3-oxo-5-alpha-steroid 4-dehydrogenase 2 [Carlito syrichta]
MNLSTIGMILKDKDKIMKHVKSAGPMMSTVMLKKRGKVKEKMEKLLRSYSDFQEVIATFRQAVKCQPLDASCCIELIYVLFKVLTFVYALLTRGRPFPLIILFKGVAFCIGNGFLQGYYLIYCAEYPADWYTDIRFGLGVFLFVLGMGINIQSDYILRQLRKPGEITYRIPQGGLFTYVSGANFLGEIVEWIGYALATWSPPALAFAFFSLCFLGLRAFHHHRFYLKMFEDYPKSRKALIPFIF